MTSFRVRPMVAVALAAATAVTAVGVSAASSSAAPEKKGSTRAKNVIYLLGDGMGRTHVTRAGSGSTARTAS